MDEKLLIPSDAKNEHGEDNSGQSTTRNTGIGAIENIQDNQEINPKNILIEQPSTSKVHTFQEETNFPTNSTYESQIDQNNLLVERHSKEIDLTNLQNPNENISDLVSQEPPSKGRHVQLYAEDTGPKLYPVKGNLVTPPIIVKNLPEMFSSLPIYGQPNSKSELEDFQNQKLIEFVGSNLSQEEFTELSQYCSVDHLKTGKELEYQSKFPTPLDPGVNLELTENEKQLCTFKRHKQKVDKDSTNNYTRKLKYRSLRLTMLTQDDEESKVDGNQQLMPGKDMLLRVRLYRPFVYNVISNDRNKSSRHSMFSSDLLLTGRQRLSALRDRVSCANDVGMRVDVSARPDRLPTTSAKDIFPSGFLFINNIFYIDTRDGCRDLSAPIRKWASERGLGDFECRDMCEMRLDEMVIKLGHPEVYVHQGNCEHLFTFSEIRLVNPTDPLTLSHYPCHTAVSNNRSLYCTSCAEFGAKWIVVGCSRLPFDPAFACDTCFQMYLYKDGKKVCDFKAYSYKGNEMSITRV